MAIFASPDFGAKGGIVCVLLVVWPVVLVFVLVGIIRGVRLLGSDTRRGKIYGVLLVLVSVLMPLLCCQGPPHVVRIVYGNYPIGKYPEHKITVGMSFDEVSAILGSPHERFEQGHGETWYYWIDWLDTQSFFEDSGPDGRVTRTSGTEP
jgi:hypothetical protein